VQRELTAQQIEQELQATVDRLLGGKEPIRVLEAGCGSASNVRFPGSAYVVGIDISPSQLDRNESIDEKILGDVQTFDLPAEAFDAVVCWNVLEHLKDPDAAVRRFCATLRPGGVLILACPHPHSFKGLGARLTPHWLHVWFYRHVLGVEGAGVDDPRPFPTVMSSRIAPGAICELAASRGLTTELRAVSAGTQWGVQNSLVQRVIEPALRILAVLPRLVTFGKYRGEQCETRLVLRKTASTP
jgi:SAM-dependent methyltransferase